MIVSSCIKLSYLSEGTRATSFPMFFWQYCKDMETSYFGLFGHVWIFTPKMVVSTCRKFQCFSKWQKYTPFTSSLRYYILKNPAARLENGISAHNSRTRIIGSEISITILVSILDYFHKTNDKIFQKIKKSKFCGHFGQFLPKFGEKWIFLEKRALLVFKYSNYVPCCKNSEKSNNPFW